MIYVIAVLLLILVLAYEPAADLLASLLALAFQLIVTIAFFAILIGGASMVFLG